MTIEANSYGLPASPTTIKSSNGYKRNIYDLSSAVTVTQQKNYEIDRGMDFYPLWGLLACFHSSDEWMWRPESVRYRRPLDLLGKSRRAPATCLWQWIELQVTWRL